MSVPLLDRARPAPKGMVHIHSLFAELVKLPRHPADRDRHWMVKGPEAYLEHIGFGQFLQRLSAAGSDMADIEGALKRLGDREAKIGLVSRRPLGVDFPQWYIAGGVIPAECHVTVSRKGTGGLWYTHADLWVYDYANKCVATTSPHGGGPGATLDLCLSVIEDGERDKLAAVVLAAVDGSTEAKRLAWELFKAQLDHELRVRDEAWMVNARRLVGELDRATAGWAFNPDKYPAMCAAIPRWAHYMHAKMITKRVPKSEEPPKKRRRKSIALVAEEVPPVNSCAEHGDTDSELTPTAE